MYSYDGLRTRAGNRVSQTIDSPILIFDYFEIFDVFAALAVILIFGVMLYSWGTMCLLLAVTLGVVPVVRRRHQRGILFHWPYRHLGMSLPGLLNPRGRRKFSD